MAARKTLGLSEATRARIQATVLAKRLHDHVIGACELSATQVRAAEILLRKVVPDLQAVEHSGEVAVRAFAIPLEAPDVNIWAQHSRSLSGDPIPAPKLLS